MNIQQSILKCCSFIIILSSVLFFIKTKSPAANTGGIINALGQTNKNTNTYSHFFIGSSRVQRSVNPEIINSHFPNASVQNIGISGATFTCNVILADYILKNQPPEVLFIELSPILTSFPENFIKFTNTANIDIFTTLNSITKENNFREQITFKMELINQRIFNTISIKEDFKSIFYDATTLGNKERDKIGYTTSQENKFKDTTSFITFKEINTPFYKKLTSYHNYIHHLVTLGTKKGTKILFFLPITYRKKIEKEIVIPIYQTLPDSIKISYPKQFISQITNTNYLLDKNHFNTKGANAYTKLLCPIIKPYFKTQ